MIGCFHFFCTTENFAKNKTQQLPFWHPKLVKCVDDCWCWAEL